MKSQANASLSLHVRTQLHAGNRPSSDDIVVTNFSGYPRHIGLYPVQDALTAYNNTRVAQKFDFFQHI